MFPSGSAASLHLQLNASMFFKITSGEGVLEILLLCLHLLKIQFLVSIGIDETVSGVCGMFVISSVLHGKGQVLLWSKVQTHIQLLFLNLQQSSMYTFWICCPCLCARLFRSSRMLRTCSNEVPFVSCQVRTLPSKLSYCGIQTLSSL